MKTLIPLFSFLAIVLVGCNKEEVTPVSQNTTDQINKTVDRNLVWV